MKTPLNYLRFWGVRGSYPAPLGSHLRVGGNTSCIELCVDGHLLICDGGTGIIPLGNALMAQNEIRELTIILTHYHWDHISGLPFFVPAFVPGWKIHFFGPGNCPKEIEARIAGQMQTPYFPVEIETWLADIHYLTLDEEHQLSRLPFTIYPFYVHHPGSTFGYRIEVNGKVIVYVSDNELAFIDQTLAQRQSEMDTQEMMLINQMVREERENAQKNIRDADIFIHDAQYTAEDYDKKRGWGHSCYLETVDFARDAGVKGLYLFHVDPNYNDTKIESLHQHALSALRSSGSNMECHIAREGLFIDLDR